MKTKLVKCPICKKKYLKHALYQHIAQMAGKEAQYQMCMLVNTSGMKPRTFSPRILLRENAKHRAYYRKYKKKKETKSIYDL